MRKLRLTIIFLLLSILFCPILKGQVDTIDNKVIVKNYERHAYHFHDFDNNNTLWFGNFSINGMNIYQIDNNLNIIDSIINPVDTILLTLYFSNLTTCFMGHMVLLNQQMIYFVL